MRKITTVNGMPEANELMIAVMNNIFQSCVDLRAIVDEIEKTKQLEKIELQYTTIPDGDHEIVIKALKELQEVYFKLMGYIGERDTNE